MLEGQCLSGGVCPGVGTGVLPGVNPQQNLELEPSWRVGALLWVNPMGTSVLELSQRVSALLQVSPGCQSPPGAALPKTLCASNPSAICSTSARGNCSSPAMACVQEPSARILLGELEAPRAGGRNKGLGMHQDLPSVAQFLVSSMEHFVLVLCLLIVTIIPPGPERLCAIQE